MIRASVVLPTLFVLVLMITSCRQRDSDVGIAADAVADATGGLLYVVDVDPVQPLRLRVRLNLQMVADEARDAKVRGQDFGLTPQVVDVRCDGAAIPSDTSGIWRVPAGCRDLAWGVEVIDAVPGAVNAALQSSWYFADRGWWLLSEPTSLLRVEGIDPALPLSLRIEGLPAADRIVGATEVGEGAWRVPPVGSAPEFYAFGALSTQAHDFGQLHATYVLDDEARFSQLPLLELHRDVLGYLSGLFGVSAALPERDRHLLVVWLAIDEGHGEAGGAAGSRSFLANYVAGDRDNIQRNAVRTMLVLAHEQVHQLHDLLGSAVVPLPAWFNESLAHHYALKALARSDLDPGLLAALRSVFIDAERPVDAGLVELGRRHAAGDPEAYDMFYLQGATFWDQADRLIESRHPGSGGLDALIPELLATSGEGEGMPKPLLTRLLERGGEDMQGLIDRYVGE